MRTSRILAALLFPVLLLAAGSAPCEGREKYRRSIERYEVPDVVLVNQDRQKVRLQELLLGDKPVLVDFIYGTCTTICPVLSAGFANLQKKLAPDSGQVRLVSITIDPEYDTPEVMTEYLRRYGRRPGWDFLTGSRADIDRVLRALDAYVPDKMSHYPLTLMKGPGEGHWVRIYGLIGTRDLLAEYEKLRQP